MRDVGIEGEEGLVVDGEVRDGRGEAREDHAAVLLVRGYRERDRGGARRPGKDPEGHAGARGRRDAAARDGGGLFAALPEAARRGFAARLYEMMRGDLIEDEVAEAEGQAKRKSERHEAGKQLAL